MNTECATFHELLNDALDGSLPSERQALFDAHFLLCPACVRRMKDLVVVKAASRAARESNEDAFAVLPESLVARIVAAQRAEGSRRAGVAGA